MARVLVILSGTLPAFPYGPTLLQAGHMVDTAEWPDPATQRLEKEGWEVVLTGPPAPFEELTRLWSPGGLLGRTPVIVVGGPNNAPPMIGPLAQLPEPFTAHQLVWIVGVAMEQASRLRELDRHRQYLDAVFTSTHEAVLIVDGNLMVRQASDAARRVCHFPGPIIDHPFPESRGGCPEVVGQLLRQVMERKKAVRQKELPCPEPEMANVMMIASATPILDERSQVTGAVLVVQARRRHLPAESVVTGDLADECSGDEQHCEEGGILLADENDEPPPVRGRFHRMIGASAAMQEVYALIEDLAGMKTTTLITGESGTGKELVSEAIHYQGPRARKPLVKVNCAALTDTLLESELFGHVKGAFTGAIRDRMGRFQSADGGTIFLDEIGDISPNMQTRLLRILQEGEFERVGDNKTIRVDVRVIAATNQDLRTKATAGKFREDLYYRLNVVEIRLPSLRERKDDLPLLVDHFLTKFNAKYGKRITAVSSKVMRMFRDYAWPGNIRELEHVIEHAFVTCHQSLIKSRHLPKALLTAQGVVLSAEGDLAEQDPEAEAPVTPPVVVAPPAKSVTPVVSPDSQSERESIMKALEATHWKKNQAAKLMGISRSALYRKLEKYQIQ